LFLILNSKKTNAVQFTLPPEDGGISGAIEKRSFAALRCKPRRSTYIYIRLAVRFFARLASEHIVKSYGFYRQGKCYLYLRLPAGLRSR
jgi:hypothetical protein